MKKMSIQTGSLNFNVTGTGNPTAILNDNTVVEIETDNLVIDNEQQFKIHNDTISFLAKCIQTDGQISPCVVIPLADGKYQIVDGRHRYLAVKEAGLPFVKCIIRNDLATDKVAYKKVQLTTNLARNNDYLPSELAYGYKELQELGYTRQQMSAETDTDEKKIYRYIRLNNLIKPLLDMTDNEKIPVLAAVELSYLSENEQTRLFEFLLNNTSCKVSLKIAKALKKDFANYEYYFWHFDYDNYIVNNPDNDFSDTETDNLSAVSDTKEEKAEERVKEENTESSLTSEQLSVSPAVEKTRQTDADTIQVIAPENISLSDRSIIAKTVITATRIDYYIIREFFDANDCYNYLKKNYIESYYTAVGVKIDDCRVSYNFRAAHNMFSIKVNKTTYIMQHKILERIVRQYIREHYTTDDIVKIIKIGVENED